MRIHFMGFLLFVFSGQVWASADYTLIQDLLGTYKILEWNSEANVAGTVTVFADASGVGIKVKPLALGGEPAPNMTVATSQADTILLRESDRLRQEYKGADGKVRLEYHFADGYLRIFTESCLVGQGCSSNEATVTRGGAPGVRLENHEFLRPLAGTYSILKAGGQVPKEGTNAGDVDVESDPAETAFYFPYCLESGACDAGYVGFPYESTKVFRHSVGLDTEIFYLLVGSGPDVAVFSWEQKVDRLVFRNFQYPLGAEKVCLEYELRRQ